MLKALLIILTHFFTYCSITPPNFGQEMGTQEGDKVTNDKLIKNYGKMIIVFLTLFQVLTVHYMINYYDQSLTFYDWFLFLIMVFGFSIRMYSYWELGNLFTYSLGIRKDHKLVTTGPYEWLAHPSYTGHIIMGIVPLLFFKLPLFVVLLIAVPQTWSLVNKRIPEEEAMMRLQFGADYDAFLVTRAKLIPGIY